MTGFFLAQKHSLVDRMLTHFLVKPFLRLLILFFSEMYSKHFYIGELKTRDLFKRLKKDTQFSLGV